jgi:hypothetical protein
VVPQHASREFHKSTARQFELTLTDSSAIERSVRESETDDLKERQLTTEDHDSASRDDQPYWQTFAVKNPACWKTNTLDVSNVIDDDIIAKVDEMESIMSFEEDYPPRVTLKEYWSKLSHLLGYAFASGSPRAMHALDVHRYTARGWQDQWMPSDISRSGLYSALIGCLARSSRETLNALAELAVYGEHLESKAKRVPFEVVVDCLYHLRQIGERWQEIEENPLLYNMFQEQLKRLHDPETWPKFDLKPRQLRLILALSGRTQTLKIARAYLDVYPFHTDKALLALVEIFTDLGDTTTALEFLSRCEAETLQKPGDECLGRVVKLLQHDIATRDGQSYTFRLLPEILRLGVPATDIIQNMVVQNAAKSGLLEVAFDLFRYLKDKNISVGGHTYTVLLRQSFLQGDGDAVQKILRIIRDDDRVVKSPVVVCQILNVVGTICRRHKKLPPPMCMAEIMAVYDQHYNRDMLVRYGIAQPRALAEGDPELPDPHHLVFGMMVLQYVYCQQQEAPVNALWPLIRATLDNNKSIGYASVRQSAREGHMLKSFLNWYARHAPTTLYAMMEVLEDMMEFEVRLVTHRVWATVIGAFGRCGKYQDLEKVRDIMRSLGEALPPKEAALIARRLPESAVVAGLWDDAQRADVDYLPKHVDDDDNAQSARGGARAPFPGDSFES